MRFWNCIFWNHLKSGHCTHCNFICKYEGFCDYIDLWIFYEETQKIYDLKKKLPKISKTEHTLLYNSSSTPFNASLMQPISLFVALSIPFELVLRYQPTTKLESYKNSSLTQVAKSWVLLLMQVFHLFMLLLFIFCHLLYCMMLLHMFVGYFYVVGSILKLF